MSDFPGVVPEIPGLSIDRFNGQNYNSTVYLLSHCHFDHLEGIDDPWFLENLFIRPDVFIYMSEVSVKILRGLKPVLSSKLKHLPINSATLLKVPSKENNCDNFISVTLIPAGHCPGSVMFLIEKEKAILYTGDFRTNPEDIKKFKAFYNLENLRNQVKKINKVYLDTTFFHTDYLSFPSRKNTIETLYSLITEWILQDEKNIIFLRTSAHIGYEDLLIELYKKLNISIHVNKSAYDVYKHFPEMDKAVTLNECSRIHACYDGNPKIAKKTCDVIKNQKVNTRIIKLSAFRWTEKKQISDKNYFDRIDVNYYCVCYSTHASFEEIKEFMLFLKPEEIQPCVYYNDEKKTRTMLTLIEEILDSYKIVEPKKLTTFLLPKNKNIQSTNKTQNSHKVKCDIINLLQNTPPIKKPK